MITHPDIIVRSHELCVDYFISSIFVVMPYGSIKAEYGHYIRKAIPTYSSFSHLCNRFEVRFPPHV